MKAISLWQPYATLVAIGAKRFETRHWPTNYRGDIVIHAAKRWTAEEREIIDENPFYDILRAAGYEDALPLGVGLCVAQLVNVYRTDELLPRLIEKGQQNEIEFGNYQPGRYAWRLENIRPFAQPIPAKGQQGLWDWTLPL